MVRRSSRWTCAVLAALGISGCAHLSGGTVGYYLPMSDVRFRVIRVMACDKQNNLIESNQVTPTVRSFADPDDYRTVRLQRLRGAFSDTDVKFEFFDDKRLSAINASSTGQGEAILKTVISIATTVLGAGIGLAASDPAATCQQVKAFGGDKPLTLTYEGLVNLNASPRQSQPIPATPDSAYFVEQLGAGIGSVNATVLGHEIPKAPFSDPDIDPGLAALDTARVPIIAAKEPGSVLIEIDSGRENKAVWKDKLQVAAFGTIYYLPLPGPLLFGKKSLSASFTETGSLKSLQYVSNTGAGQALNVIGAGLSGPNQAVATKAAEIKAEADVIAQQQRLVACRSDPTTCK